MRTELLEALQAHKGEFLSGEKISQLLGCTRAAVWKHIEELRKNGYKVEAAPRKGYRIIHSPNALTENEVKAGLKTNSIGKEIVYFETLSSTQEVAHKLALEGASCGTVVVSDEQTTGRGRLGRKWFSEKGTGIWMSIILRPNISPQKAPQLTLLTAVAVVKAIKKSINVQCEIKWPNDVLISGKKVVGILTEMNAEPDHINYVIVGIGLNVNQDKFPDDINEIATSLRVVKKEEIKRAALMQDILEQFEKIYEQYLVEGFSSIKRMWETFSITIGRNIKATSINGEVIGFASGITEEGVLLVKSSDGTTHKIYSADIEFK